MSLINVNLTIPDRIAVALERIAGALDRAIPLIIMPGDPTYKKRDATSVMTYGKDSLAWQKERILEALQPGLSKEQEKLRVQEIQEELLSDDLDWEM